MTDQYQDYGRYDGPDGPTQQFPAQQSLPLPENAESVLTGGPERQQEPAQTFRPIPGFAQRGQDSQPDGTPRYTSNGFTAEERSARSAGQKGTIGNWFRTGDAKLDPDSEQGRKLAPAIAEGWSVAGLICAFFVPLAGLVLSIVAFADAKKNHRRVHGTAIGGFVVGALGSIAWTLYWVFVIVAMAALTNAVNSYPTGG